MKTPSGYTTVVSEQLGNSFPIKPSRVTSAISVANLLIKKAGTYGFYDIFSGLGWKNHTRIQVRKQNEIVRVYPKEGRSLLPLQLAAITKELSK